VSEWVKEITKFLSSIIAAFAAYFSCRAIVENRKNVFLFDKNRLVLSVNSIASGFESKFGDFKISEYSDEQARILASKYYFDPEYYGRFTDVLVRLHGLEKKEGEWPRQNTRGWWRGTKRVHFIGGASQAEKCGVGFQK